MTQIKSSRSVEVYTYLFIFFSISVREFESTHANPRTKYEVIEMTGSGGVRQKKTYQRHTYQISNTNECRCNPRLSNAAETIYHFQSNTFQSFYCSSSLFYVNNEINIYCQLIVTYRQIFGVKSKYIHQIYLYHLVRKPPKYSQ